MDKSEFDAAATEAAVLAERQADLYALFGHPVAHSKSPFIHARFAETAKQRLRYIAVDAPPEDFAQLLGQFAEEGGRGANVTLPLKGLAHDLCAELSESARVAGAANTLTRMADGRWRGDNTDGIGLVRDIAERHRIDLRGRRALMIGAGGAARGVVAELLSAGVQQLTIVNRSAERADALADRFGNPDKLHTLYWEDLADAGSFDLILNATSAGRLGEAFTLPFSLAGARALCYDLSYGDAARGFLAWARAAKAAYALDGLGMLVEQAAESFQIWRGLRPDTEPVFQALRARMSGA